MNIAPRIRRSLWAGTAAVIAVSPLLAAVSRHDRVDVIGPRPTAVEQLDPALHPGLHSGSPEPGSASAPATGGKELPAGWVMTGSGPLGPADRDLLVRVRLAGLWEAPVGQQAQQRAGSTQVKEVGAHLATEHADLDAEVRSIAAQLGIDLPSQPNAEQQGWMAELSGKSGQEYDDLFIGRLRAAHGKVFSVVSAVRAGTRNDLIRSFAQNAVTVVMRHMTYLESTGIVDYSALPAPPVPGASPAVVPAGGPRALTVHSAGAGGGYLPVVWIVLIAAAVAGAWTTIRVIRLR